MRKILCWLGLHKHNEVEIPTTRRDQSGYHYVVTFCKYCKKRLKESEVRKNK